MAYTKTVWVDEVLDGSPTYEIDGIGGKTIALETTVLTAGTSFNATLMNKIEQGIYDSGGTTDQYYTTTSTATDATKYFATDYIPSMTSASAPSPFVISDGGNAGASNAGWKAFDNDPVTVFISNTNNSGNVTADLNTNTVIAAYNIASATNREQDPKNWTLQGSLNGSTWTTLDTRTNITFGSFEKKTFVTSNTTAYRYYKLNVTATGNSSFACVISDIELFKISPSAYSINPGKITAYTDGMRFMIEANATCAVNVTPTLNIDGVGAKPIIGATMVANRQYEFRYDSGIDSFVATLQGAYEWNLLETAEPTTNPTQIDINVSGYSEYLIEGQFMSDASVLTMRLNDLSTSIYDRVTLNLLGTTVAGSVSNSQTLLSLSNCIADDDYPTNTGQYTKIKITTIKNKFTMVEAQGMAGNGGATYHVDYSDNRCMVNSTLPVTKISLRVTSWASANAFKSGTKFKVYGRLF